MSNNLETSKYTWEIHNTISDEILLATEDYPKLLQQLLHNRNITTESEISSFLDPIESINSYSILPNIAKATDYIANVIRNNKKICVFGDFDVDGISATAILGRTFQAAGVSIIPHIPNRFTEGHGLNREAIKMLKDLTTFSLFSIFLATLYYLHKCICDSRYMLKIVC